MRIVLILALLGWWAVQARAYVPVWQSNETLMRHVVTLAPSKPRALLNYGVMLAAAGRRADGAQLFLAAEVATQGVHVSQFDRRLTARDLATNRAALADRGGGP